MRVKNWNPENEAHKATVRPLVLWKSWFSGEASLLCFQELIEVV